MYVVFESVCKLGSVIDICLVVKGSVMNVYCLGEELFKLGLYFG